MVAIARVRCLLRRHIVASCRAQVRPGSHQRRRAATSPGPLLASAPIVSVSRGQIAVILALLATARPAAAQESLGHKIPGALGMDAGTQAKPGVYLANRTIFYDAIRLRDRNGGRVPIEGFDLNVFADAIGVAWTVEIGSGVHLGASFAAPYARLSLTTDDPLATVDRSGLAAVFVEPARLGWRGSHVDVVATYGFYAPTNQLGSEGLASPQWAHQPSVGGAFHFDRATRWRLSARASYDIHERKLAVDVTRGESVQIQGGLGGAVLERLEVGVAGYALWQVSDDGGAELPAPLRGRRDRGFGLGPEVILLIPELRATVGLRYLRDFAVQARPEGQILVASLAVQIASLAAP